MINNVSNSTGGGLSMSGAASGELANCTFTGNEASKGGGIAIHNAAKPKFYKCRVTENAATTAGAVLVTDLASPAFFLCTFEDNLSQTSGGGILATDKTSGLFSNCSIIHNTAESGTGGGFLLEDFTRTEIIGSTVSHNLAYSGGGLMVTSKDQLSIIECIFYNNTVSLNGGAMTFDEASVATVLGGECYHNFARGRGGCASIQGIAKPIIQMHMHNNVGLLAGGGLFAASNSNITIYDSKIEHNDASVGGGIFIESSVQGTMNDCFITNNTAVVGGGGFIQGAGVSFRNLVVDSNSANNGGGLAIEGSSPNLHIANTTVSNNIANYTGGGMYLTGSAFLPPIDIADKFNVEYLMLANNTASEGAGIFCATKNPPTFGSSIIIQHNNASLLGGAMFISGSQPQEAWFFDTTFYENSAVWGGCSVAWNYMSNISIADIFCLRCAYSACTSPAGYQNQYGQATLPFQVAPQCPPYVTLDSDSIDITLTIKDQFKTIVTGDLLRANTFNVTLRQIIENNQTECTMEPSILSREIDPKTGKANFEGLKFTGKQNSTCLLEFTTICETVSTSVQTVNCSVILYGCKSGYTVSSGASTDECVARVVNYIELLLLFVVFFFSALVCMLIIAGGMHVRRKREKENLKKKQGLLELDADAIITIADVSRDPSIPNIKWKDITLIDRIGRGATGLVWHAKWNRGNGEEDVAVKELLVTVDKMGQQHLRDFLYEIKIMSSLFHKKVVRFIGITFPMAQKVNLVSELMHKGSLRDLLDSVEDFSWDLRLKFAIDAAKGVEYLHGRGLLHRDLKTSNLLVNEDCVCKVADFGISTVKVGTSVAERCVGTPVYMAPEVLQDNTYSKQADTFSWGIILYELYTKKYPYSDSEYSNMHIAKLTYEISFNGARPDVSGIHPVVKSLIVDCWSGDPYLRPNFSEIIKRLKRIKKMKLDLDTEQQFSDNVSSPNLPLLMTNSDGSDPQTYGSIQNNDAERP